MKKLTTCIIAVMLVFISLSGIYATSNISILDTKYTENIYKFSDDGDIYLPFLRMSKDRIVIDKDVNESGISFASGTISVLNNLKGIQTLASSDTVRVTGNMEYGIIIAPTVIVEGTIDKSLVIVSQNITIAKDAVIKEDLLCSTEKIDLLGKIEGNLLGSIEQANISGSISKDFRAKLGNITLNEGSKIQGNIYISSYNNIDISDKYPNATINILKNTEEKFNIDIWGIVRLSLIFALIYLLASNKTDIFKNAISKVKIYKISTVIIGLSSIILLPAVVIALFVLTLVGFGIITAPITILYVSFMLVSYILSTFVIGSLMSEYISNKYSDKVKGNWYKLVLSFFTFFVLGLIVNLPTVGSILSFALCMLSAGIVFTMLFRKIKE